VRVISASFTGFQGKLPADSRDSAGQRECDSGDVDGDPAAAPLFGDVGRSAGAAQKSGLFQLYLRQCVFGLERFQVRFGALEC
jgi:hypothetical protein